MFQGQELSRGERDAGGEEGEAVVFSAGGCEGVAGGPKASVSEEEVSSYTLPEGGPGHGGATQDRGVGG
jgi:hypothetical protein